MFSFPSLFISDRSKIILGENFKNHKLLKTPAQTCESRVHGEKPFEGEMHTTSEILSTKFVLIPFSRARSLILSISCSQTLVPHLNINNGSDGLQRTLYSTHHSHKHTANANIRVRTRSSQFRFAFFVVVVAAIGRAFGFTQCTPSHYRQYRIERFAGNSLQRRRVILSQVYVFQQRIRFTKINKYSPLVNLLNTFALVWHRFATPKMI